jgi:hypothetical protein
MNKKAKVASTATSARLSTFDNPRVSVDLPLALRSSELSGRIFVQRMDLLPALAYGTYSCAA